MPFAKRKNLCNIFYLRVLDRYGRRRHLADVALNLKKRYRGAKWKYDGFELTFSGDDKVRMYRRTHMVNNCIFRWRRTLVRIFRKADVRPTRLHSFQNACLPDTNKRLYRFGFLFFFRVYLFVGRWHRHAIIGGFDSLKKYRKQKIVTWRRLWSKIVV